MKNRKKNLESEKRVLSQTLKNNWDNVVWSYVRSSKRFNRL